MEHAMQHLGSYLGLSDKRPESLVPTLSPVSSFMKQAADAVYLTGWLREFSEVVGEGSENSCHSSRLLLFALTPTSESATPFRCTHRAALTEFTFTRNNRAAPRCMPR